MSLAGPTLNPPYPAPLPPQPARKRDRGVIVAIVVGVVVVLLACAGGLALGLRQVAARHAAAVRATEGPAATGPAVPSATPSASASSRDHSGDLRRFLLKMPADAIPWSHPLGTNGHLSVAQESALAPNPDLRAALFHRYFFQEGATANWVEPNGTSVDIRLFRFDGPHDALWFFNESESASNRASPTSKGFTFATDDRVPNSDIISSSIKDKYGHLDTHSLALRDDVVIEIWIIDRHPVSLSFTRRLLTAQWNRL